MNPPAMHCPQCGSLLSAVTWTCVRGRHCKPRPRIRTAPADRIAPHRWTAWDDRYDPDDRDYRLGTGQTEAEAVADLMEQMEVQP